MEELSILAAGETVGRAEITEEGLYLRFTADCRAVSPEPCRLFLVGQRGRLRLGVPEPEGERLRLSRCLSRRDCAAAGHLTHLELELPERKETAEDAEPAEPVWQPLGSGERWLPPRLRAKLPRGAEVLTAQVGEYILAALPYDAARPFPWVELFCFARIRTWAGKSWVVFSFDRQGRPVMPEKGPKN